MVHRPAHRTGLAFLQIGRQHARAPRTLQLLQPLQRRRIGIVVRFRVFQAAQRLLMRPFRKCRRSRQLGATVDHLLRIALRRLGTLDRRMRLAASRIGAGKRVERSLCLLGQILRSRLLRNACLQILVKFLRAQRSSLRRGGLARILASIRQHACRLVHLRLRGVEAPLRFSLAHFRIRQLFDR